MRVSHLYLITILAVGLVVVAALISSQATPPYTQRTITIDQTGYQSLTDMTESTKMIIVGTVTKIKSTTGPFADISMTRYEVRIDRWLKPSTANNFTTVTIIQNGSRDSTGSTESLNDPLMKVGEQNVFFLFGGEGDGTQKPYSTMGEWGRFRIQEDDVHPIIQEWQEFDGINLDVFLGTGESRAINEVGCYNNWRWIQRDVKFLHDPPRGA